MRVTERCGDDEKRAQKSHFSDLRMTRFSLKIPQKTKIK